MSIQEQSTDYPIGYGTFDNTSGTIKLALHQSHEDIETRQLLVLNGYNLSAEEFRARIYIVDSDDIVYSIGLLEADYNPSSNLAFWKTFLIFDRWRSYQPPNEDRNIKVIWDGFERSLKFTDRDLSWMVAPAINSFYDSNDWRIFLLERGYRPRGDQFFKKLIN